MSGKSLDDLIKRIYHRRNESVWTLTVGKKQSGKTNWNLDQMDRIHELGLGEGFGSNIPLEAPFDIDFIDDFETLEQTCRMLNPDPKRHGLKRYFFFGSEMGKWLPKDQSWRNIKFIEKLQLVRKYGLCWLGDGIDRIDERVFNEHHFNGYFVKPSVANPTIARYIDWTHRDVLDVLNIPKTRIEFDTYYSANFYMEPQLKDGAVIPLNPEHEIVFKYLDLGSWKKVGVDTQTGKRAVQKVLRFHRTHCLHKITEENSVLEPIESEIAKDSVEVTE